MLWRPIHWCINNYCRTDIDEARVISAFRHKSKFNLELFWKKIKFLSFHAVVLMKTFLLMYQLPMQDWYWRSYGDFSSSAQVIIRISNFFEKNQIFGFPCCSTREDLSIDVSITNVGLILTKLWWFQLFSTSQNSNFELFWKKVKFLGSHAAVLVKTFPLMYQLLM